MAAADNDHVESGGVKHWETGEGGSGEPNNTALRCKNTALRTPVEAKINAFTTAYRILKSALGALPAVRWREFGPYVSWGAQYRRRAAVKK
ncbi:hypothetical protein ZRA01_24450 [Zoogloea ramigera]|uniref:Uncharacterized protein n=1 Tax=Zoogloea ramigera TaxID=350 RepID=A0A4Y4CW72_ZOORA|nr:hypothetical protein ZRA01_24450 [Zoogloea ramigera]